MSTTNKPKCAGRVWRTFRYIDCHHPGKLEHDGKLYCGNHHPPTVAEKQAKRNAERRAEEVRKRAAWKAAEAERKATELRATPDDELAAECERRGWKVTR